MCKKEKMKRQRSKLDHTGAPVRLLGHSCERASRRVASFVPNANCVAGSEQPLFGVRMPRVGAGALPSSTHALFMQDGVEA